MKYYDKLIFEISRPGRVGYSLPKFWTTDNRRQTSQRENFQFSILNFQFPKPCFATLPLSFPK